MLSDSSLEACNHLCEEGKRLHYGTDVSVFELDRTIRAPSGLHKNAPVLGLAKGSTRLLKFQHDKVVSNDGINFSVRPGSRHGL